MTSHPKRDVFHSVPEKKWMNSHSNAIKFNIQLSWPIIKMLTKSFTRYKGSLPEYIMRMVDLTKYQCAMLDHRT